MAVRPALAPDPKSVSMGLLDLRLRELGSFAEASMLPCPREIRYSDAIAEVTGHWLETDSGVVVMGEEVANMASGAYGATR